MLVSLITAVQAGVRVVSEGTASALTIDCLDDAFQTISQLGASVSSLSKQSLGFSLALHTALSYTYALL